MLQLQNSAEPGTMSQVGDADAGLRERVAGEDRLTAVSHSRAGALSHLPVQEVGEEGGDSSQPAGPTGPRAPGFTVSSQGSATGPCNPASCDRCCPPHQRPFLLFNQTLQTSTHTGPGSGKNDSLLWCSYSPPQRSSIPFLIHLGEHPPASTQRHPTEIGPGAPTLDPPGDGVVSLAGSLEGG